MPGLSAITAMAARGILNIGRSIRISGIVPFALIPQGIFLEPVSMISEMLGFDYPQHFVRFFKAHTGKTPSAYRKVS